MGLELVPQEEVQVGRKRNTKDSILSSNVEKDEIMNKKMVPTFVLNITPSDVNYRLFTAGPAREYLPRPSIHEVKGAVEMVLTDITDINNIQVIRTKIYYPKIGSEDLQIRGNLDPFFTRNGVAVDDKTVFFMEDDNRKGYIKHIKKEDDKTNYWENEVYKVREGIKRARNIALKFLSHIKRKYNIGYKITGSSAILDNNNIVAFMYISDTFSDFNIGGKEIFDSNPKEKIWYIFCLENDKNKYENFIIMNGIELTEKLKNVGPPGSNEFVEFVPHIYKDEDIFVWNDPGAGINKEDMTNYLNKCERLIDSHIDDNQSNMDNEHEDGRNDVPDEFFKDARPIYRNLIKDLLKDHPSTITEIYDYIYKTRPDLCPDNIRCPNVSSCKADEPRWKHQARYAKYDLSSSDSPHYAGIIEINGKWQFPESIKKDDMDIIEKNINTPIVEVIDVEEREKDIIKKKCRDLNFIEKKLVMSDIPEENNWGSARLYGLKDLLQDIPGLGEQITVIDCETCKKYDAKMHGYTRGLISAGLTDLWHHDDRHKKFRVGDVIGVALDPGNNHILYVRFRYKEKKNETDKQPVIETTETDKQPVIETTETDKQPVIETTETDKVIETTETDKVIETTETDKQPVTDINMYIDKFINNNIIGLETQVSIPDEEKEKIIYLINKDRHKIESIVNESLRPIIKDYHSKIIADKERKDQEIARIKLEEDKKKKEEQRKKDIEKKRENLYNTDIGKLILEAKNCNLYGPSGTSKTTLAQKTAGEIIGIYIEGETDNLYKEFKDKGYIIFVRVHPSYDYGRFIERKTFHTEKEGQPTLDKKFISLPGDLKIAGKKALLLAIGHDIDDKCNWSDIYNEYMLLTDEQKKEIFEYAPAIVLIIDELNRGNIQEILGEFGTMMEKDKRLGEENEVTIILKSGDIFGIPPNLYIISTMNTVDTSIVGIDVATIRRFNSVRCLPNFKIVEDYIDNARENELISEDLLDRIDNVKAALEKVNGRMRNDNEIGLYRQIGHTYLLDNKSESKLVDTESKLIMAWNNKIFPAIEVICRYDYDKIAEILFDDDKDTDLLFDDYSDKNLRPFDIEKLDNIIAKINGSD